MSRQQKAWIAKITQNSSFWFLGPLTSEQEKEESLIQETVSINYAC